MRFVRFWPILVLIILAIGTVWLRLSIVRTTYAINQTERMIRNNQNQIEKVKLRVAQLRSPGHLETLARKKFNLAPPKPEQIIRLERLEGRKP